MASSASTSSARVARVGIVLDHQRPRLRASRSVSLPLTSSARGRGILAPLGRIPISVTDSMSTLLVPPLGSRHTETIGAAASARTTIGTVKQASSPHPTAVTYR